MRFSDEAEETMSLLAIKEGKNDVGIPRRQSFSR